MITVISSLAGVLIGFALALIPYYHLKNRYDKLLNYVLAERNPPVFAAYDPSFNKKINDDDEIKRKIREAYDKAISHGFADDKDIELIGEKKL